MSSQRRADISFVFAIVMGLVLGLLIKKVRIGILLGFVVGGLILLTGWLRNTRKGG